MKYPDQERNFNIEATDDFVFYQHLLEGRNANHPQHQGLSLEEFDALLRSGQGVFTSVHEGGAVRQIPQLVPINTFEWLNSDFYQSRFPNEFQADGIMHYTDFPGIEPSEDVTGRIVDIAKKSGVIVFDYPSTEPDYPDRVRQLANRLGLTVAEESVLGRQTYFYGVTKFKYPPVERDKPLELDEANAIFKSSEQFDPDAYQNGTVMEEVITGDEEIERMYEFYSAAYSTISNHPCVQGLSPDEFKVMLGDPSVPKTTFRRNGVAESMCLITNNLGQLTWVNQGFYKRMFPEKSAKGQVAWFPGIASDPDPNKMGHNVPRLVGHIIKLMHLSSNDFVVVFDTPDINTEFLPAYLKAEIDKTPELTIDFDTLGSQEYRALKLAVQ